MGIEVRLMQIPPCRKIQSGLLRVRLAMEVPAYCIYYFPCLSFQFSVYFVVSEMRVIWVISCISNGNIDQKCFCVCKSSSNLSARFGSILWISKHCFFEKARFAKLLNAWLSLLLSKSAFWPLKAETKVLNKPYTIVYILQLK